jgi:hypothetical protein
MKFIFYLSLVFVTSANECFSVTPIKTFYDCKSVCVIVHISSGDVTTAKNLEYTSCAINSHEATKDAIDHCMDWGKDKTPTNDFGVSTGTVNCENTGKPCPRNKKEVEEFIE